MASAAQHINPTMSKKPAAYKNTVKATPKPSTREYNPLYTKSSNVDMVTIVTVSNERTPFVDVSVDACWRRDFRAAFRMKCVAEALEENLNLILQYLEVLNGSSSLFSDGYLS